MVLRHCGLTSSLIPTEGEVLSDKEWKPHRMASPSLLTSSRQLWPLFTLPLWSVGMTLLCSPHPRPKPIKQHKPYFLCQHPCCCSVLHSHVSQQKGQRHFFHTVLNNWSSRGVHAVLVSAEHSSAFGQQDSATCNTLWVPLRWIRLWVWPGSLVESMSDFSCILGSSRAETPKLSILQ